MPLTVVNLRIEIKKAIQDRKVDFNLFTAIAEGTMSAIETATAREKTNDACIVLVWIGADREVNAAVIVNENEMTNDTNETVANTMKKNLANDAAGVIGYKPLKMRACRRLQ